ncbi:hypothetical protein BDQ17DRAFT_1314549 [Cyathus striatus]|nr:hypothetical protein BDQ17DRAFT_1314549 [Cyathus striatus]
MDIISNIQLASVPFNDEKADLILHSSDGVHFYVHKVILSIASNFFRDMLSLPQLVKIEDHDLKPSPLEVSEDSCTMDALLRFCYPVRDPVVDELPVAANLKYQMNVVAETITETFKKFITSSPLKVYGLACRPGISDESLARLAAQEWMKQKASWVASFTVNWEETSIGESFDIEFMGSTTAGQLYRLLCCIRTRKLPRKLLTNDDPIAGTTSKKNDPAMDATHFSDGDIIIRSKDGVDFRACRSVLEVISNKLLSSMETGVQIQHQDSGKSSVHVYILPEHSSIIYKLLEICDPMAMFSAYEVGDANLMHGLSQVAMKYDVPRVISFIKLWWANLVKLNPVQSYFLAVRCGWEEQARQAARKTVYSSIDGVYTPEMEHESARSYYNLMKYHHACQQTLNHILGEHCPPSYGTPSICGMLFAIWEMDPSNNMQLNDGMIAFLSYIAQVNSNLTIFDIGSFKPEFNLIKSEIENSFDAIKLDWDH